MVRLGKLRPRKSSGLVLNISRIFRWPSITVQFFNNARSVVLFRMSMLEQTGGRDSREDARKEAEKII